MFATVYGLIVSKSRTAPPKEFRLSGVRLKNGATRTTAVIAEALITEGVNADKVQNSKRKHKQIMLPTFLGVFNKVKMDNIRPHQREV